MFMYVAQVRLAPEDSRGEVNSAIYLVPGILVYYYCRGALGRLGASARRMSWFGVALSIIFLQALPYRVVTTSFCGCLLVYPTDVIVAHFNNLDAPPPSFATSYIW